jgi:hypothetical protein
MNFISSRHYICIFVSLGKYFTERKRKRERGSRFYVCELMCGASQKEIVRE